MSLANILGVNARSLNSGDQAILVGAIVFSALIFAIKRHLAILLRRPSLDWGDSISRRHSEVILILIGFTLLYCINLAVGRISLGLAAGQEQRYIAYMIPGMLGIHLFVSTWGRTRNLCRAILLISLLLGTFPIGKRERAFAEEYRAGKLR